METRIRNRRKNRLQDPAASLAEFEYHGNPMKRFMKLGTDNLNPNNQ